jgi:hypothetical protein
MTFYNAANFGQAVMAVHSFLSAEEKIEYEEGF